MFYLSNIKIGVMALFILSSHFIYAKVDLSQSETKELKKILIGYADEIYSEEKPNFKETVKTIEADTEDCYFPDEKFIFFKKKFFESCKEVLESQKEKQISYFELRKAIQTAQLDDEDYRNSLLSLSEEVYGLEELALTKEQDELIEIIADWFKKCDLDKDSAFSCQKIISTAKEEEALSYLQVIEAVIQIKAVETVSPQKEDKKSPKKQVAKP